MSSGSALVIKRKNRSSVDLICNNGVTKTEPGKSKAVSPSSLQPAYQVPVPISECAKDSRTLDVIFNIYFRPLELGMTRFHSGYINPSLRSRGGRPWGPRLFLVVFRLVGVAAPASAVNPSRLFSFFHNSKTRCNGEYHIAIMISTLGRKGWLSLDAC